MDILGGNIPVLQDSADGKSIFIGSPRLFRRHAKRAYELFLLKHAHRNIGISHINRQQHFLPPIHVYSISSPR